MTLSAEKLPRLNRQQYRQLREIMSRIDQHCKQDLGIAVIPASMAQLTKAVRLRLHEIGVMKNYSLTIITYDRLPKVLDVRITADAPKPPSSTKT